MKGLLLDTVDKEVSALARLTFYANLSVYWARNKCPLSALTGVRIKQFEFKENVRARDNENCP